jgi:hypothetical protein
MLDFATQGGRRQAGAVHVYWSKLDPALKQHVTVRAAHAAALCMCAGPQEALRALEGTLQLFAALHSSLPMSVAGAQHPASDDSRSASHNQALEGPDVEHKCSSESNAVSEAPSRSLRQEHTSIRGSLDDQPLGKARALSSSAAAAGEPTWAAHRAAQAACQQVLTAAARAGLPDLAQGILQAMHQVTGAGSQLYSPFTSMLCRQLLCRYFS